MKKIIYACIVSLFVLSGTVMTIHAQSSNNHNSKGSEQALDQLMFNLFSEHIDKAVANYYKDDSVSGQYGWQNKHYDVVDVDQSEKGNVLKSPYVVKFTVVPTKITHDKHKEINNITIDPSVDTTDIITFGVEPGDGTKGMKVNLLNYDHNKPNND